MAEISEDGDRIFLRSVNTNVERPQNYDYGRDINTEMSCLHFRSVPRPKRASLDKFNPLPESLTLQKQIRRGRELE